MECEICGKTIERAIPVRIEGTIMKVCGSCARFGVQVEEKKVFTRSIFRKPSIGIVTTAAGETAEAELFDDYPSIVKAARERKGLTQEQLGKLINERESVIIRIEGGKMKPYTKLVHKLEQALGVEITGKVEGEKVSAPKPAKKELTLGDVVEIKKK